MSEVSSPACKSCGRMMTTAADIPARAGDPGLRAFICDRCGTVDSVLIYPPNRAVVQQQQQQPQPKSDTDKD
jgi:hypothetical protein